MAPFELYRRNASSSVVAPLWVVEHLDVVEDIAPGLIASGIDLPTNPFTLEQLEEALGHCVVMAVATPTHAGHQIVVAQEVLPIATCELTALIRVNGDGLLGLRRGLPRALGLPKKSAKPMPVIVFMALMLALLLFILWDRKQPAKPISKEQMSKGFVPGNGAKWAGFLGLALVGFFLALNEFLTPSEPPFTGKGSTVKILAYEVFGKHGPAFFWLLMGAVFVVVAYLSYRSKSHR